MFNNRFEQNHPEPDIHIGTRTGTTHLKDWTWFSTRDLGSMQGLPLLPDPPSQPWTLNVRPLAVFRSFSSVSGLARRSTGGYQ